MISAVSFWQDSPLRPFQLGVGGGGGAPPLLFMIIVTLGVHHGLQNIHSVDYMMPRVCPPLAIPLSLSGSAHLQRFLKAPGDF